jgi:hypothetical protein
MSFEFKSEILDISVHDEHARHQILNKHLGEITTDGWRVITVQDWHGGRYFVVLEREKK